MNATTATVTVSLSAKTYTYNTDDGFKVEKGGTYYGNNGTMTRANCSGWVFEDGKQNCGITADLAGTYTFTLNLSTMAVSATYPEAYTVNFGVSPAAAADAPTNSLSISSGSLVLSGTSITFTKDPTPNPGYTWSHWEKNSSNVGTGDTYTTTISEVTTVNAIYTEDTHTVSVVANDAYGNSHGSVSTASVTAGIATKSAEITATPENKAWRFKHWVIAPGISAADGYDTHSNPLKINATADDIKLIAYFEPRYALMGSLAETENPAGGMPSPTWDDGYAADFEVKSFTAINTDNGVDLECTRTLEPNKTYKFQVYDREIKTPGAQNLHTRLGLSSATVLPAGESVELTVVNGSGDVRIQTVGRGDYTFKITKLSSDATNNRPTITVERQASWLVSIGQGYEDVDGGIHSNTSTGGTMSATATESGTQVVITNGQYIANGGKLDWSVSPASGYTFSYYYGSANFTGDSFDFTTINSVNEAANVYAKFTENRTTVNLVASPAGKGTFTKGGVAVTSVNAGVTTNPTVTAVPATGYRVNTSATVWSESSEYISLSATNTASTTISATGATGQSADLTATFTPNTYQVQFHRNGASESTVYQDFTYDVAQNLTANTYTRTGYNFAGWATSASGEVVYADGAEVSNLTATNEGTYHLYAKWNAKTTTITLDQTGAASSGSVTTRTGTYNADMPAIIGSGSLPTAPQGYAFMGYYDALEPLGTQYYDETGASARTWNKEDAEATLYPYFKKAEITNLVAAPGVIAPGETITITPTIEPTPVEPTIVCWEIQYSNGTPLPSQPTFTPGVGNAVSFSAPTASATYRLQATLRTGSSCGGGDELSTYYTTFQVAGKHDVTVLYKDAEGNTIKASEVIENVDPLEWSGDITAPTITGYTFTKWQQGDGVTINGADGSGEKTSATITIKANYDGTLTAVYTKKRMIYFYNTLNWGSVYVYFYKNDSYWETGGDKRGSGSKTTSTWTDTPYELGKHGQMLPVSEGSNIYYFDAEAEGVPSSYKDVVFTEHSQHDYEFFYETKAVRRGDYKTSMPMFVPLADQDADVHNKTNYYNNGYWMNYPENTGYTLKIYNNAYATKETEAVQSIAFPYSEDLKMPLKMDVELSDGYNHEYWFMVYRNDGTYMGSEYHFKQGYQDEQTITGGDTKNKITTSAPGNYTFTLTYHDNGSGTVNYYIDVDFPIASGDYRIYYSDNATWSKAAHTKDSWYHPSHSIGKATTEAKKDTVSFFIPKGVGISHTMKFQKASVTNEGEVSWEDVSGGSITIPSGVTETGVYNFIVSQPAGGASISLEKVEPYTGNFYIRTDCAGNTKWDSFKNVDHQMTYSDYAETNSGYSHYYAHWVEQYNNIKFTIANDYSMCISDTLVEDYGTTIANISNVGALNSGNASIRFMWNQATNKISRAYISGSSNISDRFLVLEGDAKMFDENGRPLTEEGGGKISGLNDNEINLVDNQNFVYERTIQVNTGAKAKLTAKYNTHVQYFKGGAGTAAADSVELLGGNADGKHSMRIVYDFKTNRLVTAYIPSGTIEDNIAINADLMIVREHQGAGQQLLFEGDGALSEVHTVYGVMRFNRWTLNNKEKTGSHDPVGDPKSSYERGLYWISFPFDVNLSDVFGFGTYGTHWIIMEYDGAARAKEGYWADSKGFWKYVTDRSNKVLEAGKGYVLALDLDLMKSDNTSFWTHNIEQVELFFPSASYVSNITATDVKTTADRHLYDAAAHPGHTDDRTYKDSHWNMIGVPSYANYGETLTSDGAEAVITWSTPTTADLPYLYEWNAVDNTYTVQTGSTYPFKSMHAYMVQYHGDMYWHLASATPPALPAPRRYEGALNPVEFRLELQQNEKMVDQTFVKMSNEENVSAGFAFDEDLSKEFNANKANIYTIVENNMPIAGNVQPMSEQTTVVPVGVKIATNGEYTFAMPDGTEGIGITLVDNETGVRTPLSALDYTVNLNAGTYNDRFVLEISPIHHMPTGIEEVSGERLEVSGARKLMIDGILYIVKDGKMFDARGARVQ